MRENLLALMPYVPFRLRAGGSSLDAVEVGLDVVDTEDHDFVDEIKATASDVRVGVLSVHAQSEAYYVHDVPGGGGADVSDVLLGRNWIAKDQGSEWCDAEYRSRESRPRSVS